MLDMGNLEANLRRLLEIIYFYEHIGDNLD
jgi:hypothetical protein